MSLYRKHIISGIALLSAVIGFFSWQNYEINKKMVDNAKMQRVELLAEIVSNGLKTIMLEGKPKEDFQRFIEGLAAEDIEAVRIFSESGTILSSTVPGEIGHKIGPKHLQEYEENKGRSVFIHESAGRNVYSSIIVMSNDWPCQQCHGAEDQVRALIDLEVSHRKVDTSAKSATGWFVLSAVLMTVILSASLYFLSRSQIQKPLMHLLAEIREMAGGNLKVRASVPDTGEIGAIATSVNRLADELWNAREELIVHESRELGQMEKMASIGEVAATVAHEIKNPLAGISGALQVMTEDIPDESPRKEICNEILAEIERLDRAVKDLVAYARPQEINPVLTNLCEIIEDAVASIGRHAGSMGIGISFLAAELPLVMIDPEQMVNVVKDILLFQFSLMPDGGVINISATLKEERGEVEILCCDTGGALTDDRIRSIFKPSFSTKHTVTGLSLAIVRNILESHGGRIRVSSEFGIGNSFRIIIPLKR
ncbi:MAG: HAMP domain-containing protein [Nitrospirae bacterium]|nr:HAMP domain-containing protein [Nitrospirota bacterium]